MPSQVARPFTSSPLSRGIRAVTMGDREIEQTGYAGFRQHETDCYTPFMNGPIGTVAELFVYPVKSMAGTRVAETYVGLDGILGDRQHTFVRAGQADRNSFPWMTAREAASMLQFHPQLSHPATPGEPDPPVTIRTPDGTSYPANSPELLHKLTEVSGQPLFLLRSARGVFDCQHVSLFSLASVRQLAIEAETGIDRRQFRANIYFEPVSDSAFAEENWTNLLLQIGDYVLMGITQRDSRCMMVNLNPDSGEQDSRVLRTIAQRHQGQAGLYANVIRPGAIRVGDPIVARSL